MTENDEAPAIDTAARPGPRPCCGEFAIVAECDGTMDEFYCGICERTWTAPCRL